MIIFIRIECFLPPPPPPELSPPTVSPLASAASSSGVFFFLPICPADSCCIIKSGSFFFIPYCNKANFFLGYLLLKDHGYPSKPLLKKIPEHRECISILYDDWWSKESYWQCPSFRDWQQLLLLLWQMSTIDRQQYVTPITLLLLHACHIQKYTTLWS